MLLRHSDLTVTHKAGGLMLLLTELLFWYTVKNKDWSLLLIYRETTLFRPRPRQSYSFMQKLFKFFLKESSHGRYLYKPPTNENSDIMLVMLLEKDLVE